jgi:hypothetical protein
MNTKFSARWLGILAILMIFISACSANLQEAIIGQWEIYDEVQDVAMIFSFKEEGDLTIWLEDFPIEGTYTWLDDTTIQITMTVADQSQEILGKVKIEGDQLTITNEKGEVETLARVSE